MAAYILALNWFKMSNNDIWIHLRTGEWILDNGWVPGNDFYSWNATQRPYVAFEWLAGLFFYFIYELGGVTGLLMSKIATVVAIWALLYDTSRLLGARLSVLLPGLGIVMYIASARLLVRPHIFSYFFIALFVWLFVRYRQCGRNRLWLWALLPAQALWINTHGAWPTGIFLVTTFALGEWLAYARSRVLDDAGSGSLPLRDLKLLGWLVPMSIVVNMVNPYGWRLITFPFEVFAMKIYMTGIYEWKPPYDRSFNRSTMFFFYLVEVGMLVWGFLLANREPRKQRGSTDAVGLSNNILMVLLAGFLIVLTFWWMQPQNGTSGWNAGNLRLSMYFLFAVFSLHTVLNFRTVDFTLAGIFGMLFLISLRHNRNVTDAAIGAFPVMAASFSAAMARLGRRLPAAKPARGRGKKKGVMDVVDDSGTQGASGERGSPYPPDPSSPWSVLAWSVLLLIIAAFTATFTYYYDFKGSGREKGLGIASNMPICGVDFLERSGITGRAFTSYPYASPLIHRLYPGVTVNMDSRNGHVYGEAIYADYLRTLRDPILMRDYLAQNDVDFFFLSHGDRSSEVFEQIERSGDWATVFLDTRGFVMVRRRPHFAGLIAREEYRHIRPSSWGQTVINEATAPAIMQEAEKAIGDCPDTIFGYFYKLQAEAALGRYEDAVATGGVILEMQPRNAVIIAFVGSMYEALGRTNDAIEMFDKALAVDPGMQSARSSLTRLRGF
jgi:hypothetical protein